jgi:hypothetical protein
MTEIPAVDPNEGIPEGAECQEASPFSYGAYVPCGQPAVAIMAADNRFYYMCGPCANHNILHRRVKCIYVKPGEERWVE